MGDDSSIRATHDTMNVDARRINPREHNFLLETSIIMLGLSKDKHNAVVLGDCFLGMLWSKEAR